MHGISLMHCIQVMETAMSRMQAELEAAINENKVIVLCSDLISLFNHKILIGRALRT